MKLNAQIGEGVTQTLISVKNTTSQGNMVMLGVNRKALLKLAYADNISENMIVNIKIMKASKIEEKNGQYICPMTITRKRKKIDPNAMDVGFVDKNKYEALRGDDDEESNESELDF